MTSFGILYTESKDALTGELTVRVECTACEWAATFGGSSAHNFEYIRGYTDAHANEHAAARLVGIVDLPPDGADAGRGVDADGHIPDCAGPGCGASCRCACHAMEGGTWID